MSDRTFLIIVVVAAMIMCWAMIRGLMRDYEIRRRK